MLQLVVLIVAALGALAALADPVTIALLDDGPVERRYIPLAAIERELEALVGREFEVSLPVDYQRHGGWQVAGIAEALDSLLADPAVDIIITAGLIATHTAAHHPNLTKPVIGTAVADVVLQEFPHDAGRSGKKNFVYLADDHTVGADLDQFHAMVGFRHLVIPADTVIFDALPELPRLAARAEARLGVEIEFIEVDGRAQPVIEALPGAADAVYVPPLPRLGSAELRALAEGLAARRLPSFTLVGQHYLEFGFLMTGAGRDVDLTRAARRVALNVQAILLGRAAESLKVALSQPRKLAINMPVARAIGFAPRWQDLEGAVVLGADDDDRTPTMTLVDALEHALGANLALRLSEIAPRIAAADVSSARAELLPSLGLGTGLSVIDRDRANPAVQAQRDGDISLSARQLVYGERAWAGYTIARYLREAEDQALRVAILDTLEQTSSAYLNVLFADAELAVRRSNIQVTEANLERALARQSIGQSGRGEVLRWQSELAIDRQDFYRAQATVDTARVELRRVLNLPPDAPLTVGDDGIPALIELLGNKRFQRLFDTADRWKLMREFHVEIGLAQAPELARIDALRAGAERRVLAARRAYYVPDVSVVGRGTERLLRGGRAASLAGTGLDETDWSVGLEAELPLYLGGARDAERDQAGLELARTRLQRADTALAIRARIETAMERTAGSWPAIRLSRAAAAAARDNLDIVIDAYATGSASITELNDAQDAALTAELAAAQARYRFMLDYVQILRAVADFDVLLMPDGIERWYQDIHAYFLERGMQ